MITNQNTGNTDIEIREISLISDFHQIEEVQKAAWGFEDLDIVPMNQMVASRWAGGMTLGAFEEDRIVGFAYAFPSVEEEKPGLHSHMVAVLPERQGRGIGLRLKLAQRQSALQRGIDVITWTFDPLQVVNANLNFHRLGVISRKYIKDFYGDGTSSPLHQGTGTDRLWVCWRLASKRVSTRTKEIRSGSHAPSERYMPLKTRVEKIDEPLPFLVETSHDQPVLADLDKITTLDMCAIEVPQFINRIKKEAPGLAGRWRDWTRRAFMTAIQAGFTVQEFGVLEKRRETVYAYLLTRSSDDSQYI